MCQDNALAQNKQRKKLMGNPAHLRMVIKIVTCLSLFVCLPCSAANHRLYLIFFLLLLTAEIWPSVL